MNVKDLSGKICLITGATSGTGKETAKALAARGATVVVHGRNKEKAITVAEDIKQTTGNDHIFILLADLSTLEGVQKLADNFSRQFSHLDILVNNAGAMMHKNREESADGIESTIQINFIATFYLTALLFDSLKKSEAARIVNYSSAMHKFAKIDWNDFMMTRSYQLLRAYSNAKLYVILFTEEMENRLKQAGIKNITVNAVHPGGVRTNFANNSKSTLGFLFQLVSPLFISPQKGADTGIWLATDEVLSNQSGKYFVRRKAVPPKATYLTDENRKKAWGIAETLTNTKFL